MANNTSSLSHYRTALNKYGQTISVPVIDVRDGIVERMLATRMAKNKQSLYIPFNRYHVSYKKHPNDTQM